ncbi:MAG TPA: FecR domain-containing protein [Polyangiaceae bacterium]|jgi:hypothetical protein
MGVEMKPEDPFWQGLRADQDRARTRAGYLARAKQTRTARAPSERRNWLGLPRAGARTRLHFAGLGGAFAVAGALAIALVWRMQSTRALRFSVGDVHDEGRVGAWIAAPGDGPVSLSFSDGSLLSLASAARARVTSTDASGANIVLEKGHASASVVHRASSHWRLDVGPFEVAVVGTRFDVSWEPNEEVFQLRLDQGTVVVSGSFLREPQRLMQGQILKAFCKEQREEIVDAASEARRAETAAGVPTTMPGSGVPELEVEMPASLDLGEMRARAPQTTTKITWQRLAAAGQYRKAVEWAEQLGFAAECRRDSGEDLQLLGDAARLSGNVARAREAYSAARDKLPQGGRTAYSLGLLAFDRDGDFAGAAQWFDRYLREQPEGSLRREAEGRLMEAWQRAGAHDKARAAAIEYLRDYPNGTQAALARELANR